MMAKYFYEYGAVQERTENGPRRLIECETSALEPKKVSEDFARTICAALNRQDAAEKLLRRCEEFLSETIQCNVEGEMLDGSHVNVAASNLADEISDMLEGRAR